jgi:hypothetical protein
MADYRIVYNSDMIRRVEQAHVNAVIKTAFSIKADLDTAQTVPFLTGALNQSGYVDDSDIYHKGVQIKYSTPYAAKQYFVPMNHYTGQHANATDHWLDPYTTTKADWVRDKYAQHLANEMRR